MWCVFMYTFFIYTKHLHYIYSYYVQFTDTFASEYRHGYCHLNTEHNTYDNTKNTTRCLRGFVCKFRVIYNDI